jgi:hypothetical protein
LLLILGIENRLKGLLRFERALYSQNSEATNQHSVDDVLMSLELLLGRGQPQSPQRRAVKILNSSDRGGFYRRSGDLLTSQTHNLELDRTGIDPTGHDYPSTSTRGFK